MKRWLLRICVFLLLGAIVNVAVAIWLASDQPKLRIIPAFPDERYRDWPVADATEADREWLESRGWQATPRNDMTEYVIRNWTFSDRPGVAYRVVGEASRMNPRPRYQGLGPLLEDRLQGHFGSGTETRRPAIREVSAGWPLPSQRGRIWNSAPLIETMLGRADWQPQLMVEAERIQFPGPDPAYTAWIVPTVPIWPGFAINTVFYAALLWLLFAAPFALRRRRRIKRGLCPKCAYDLRGSASTSNACPECGALTKTSGPQT